jgi:hypothetical protein
MAEFSYFVHFSDFVKFVAMAAHPKGSWQSKVPFK